jgi:hypothetical protein
LTDLAAFLMGLFGTLVSIAPEGGTVLGIAGIGGSTLVFAAAASAAAILTIVGAILTVNALVGAFSDIMNSRRMVNQDVGGKLVAALKSCRGTSVIGWMLELSLAINEINNE